MSKRTTPHGVVVGADGSPSSRVAVRWAAREAAMRHVPLTVVHVAASLPVAASTLVWPAGRVPEEVLEIQENEARRVIADAIKVAEDSAEGRSAGDQHELFFGGPVPTLVDISKEAQMVVAGCHGRTGQHRRLLGSVSTGLIHHAHCPVAVVHDEVPRRSIGADAGTRGHRRLAGLGVGDGDRVRRSLMARCGFGGVARLERRGHVHRHRHRTVGRAIRGRENSRRKSRRLARTLSRGHGPPIGRV